jgi:hypothetical protein
MDDIWQSLPVDLVNIIKELCNYKILRIIEILEDIFDILESRIDKIGNINMYVDDLLHYYNVGVLSFDNIINHLFELCHFDKIILIYEFNGGHIHHFNKHLSKDFNTTATITSIIHLKKLQFDHRLSVSITCNGKTICWRDDLKNISDFITARTIS